MRLFEFDDTVNASMMGLLAHLKRRAKGKTGARVRTKSFLNMLSNVGVKLDVEGLNRLKDSNPAIGNLISSIDDDTIELNVGGEPAPALDNLDLDAEATPDSEMDDLDLDMGGDEMDAGGPTMDDVTEPEMDMDQAAQSQNTVQTMAKKALSRRT